MAKIHLVLGSGGARGMAHIGVIEALEEAGHEIVEIIGCSMGAVVGGIYCAGFLPAYRNWLLTLNKSSVFKLMDFTLTTHGFLKGEKVFSHILDMCGQQRIENFKIPFTVVTTDIVKQEEVLFTSGDLYQALRASISIPGIFTPIYTQDKILVDGGVVNPLPVNLVNKQDTNAIVVAVNINGKPKIVKQPHAEAENSVTDKAANAKAKKTKTTPWPFNMPFFKKNSNLIPSKSVFELLQTSYDSTQNRLTQTMIDLYKPDFVINVSRNTCGVFDFYKASQMLEIGNKKALKMMRKNKFLKLTEKSEKKLKHIVGE